MARRYPFPVDGEGKPTSETAYRLISYFFRHRDSAFVPDGLVVHVGESERVLSQMCRRLLSVGVIKEDTYGVYRYDLNSWNVDLQGKVEAALVRPD
jgi:hypothetical protein